MSTQEYEQILAGTLALGYMDCTLLEYARGIKYFVDQEARKYNCDTHLINLLRRAACAGWENIRLFEGTFSGSVSLPDRPATTTTEDPVKRARELLSKATPGPWKAQRNARLEIISSIEPFEGCGWGQAVAHIYRAGKMNGTPYRMPAIANAELIAAAPELLTALADECERLRERFSVTCHNCGERYLGPRDETLHGYNVCNMSRCED